MSWVESDIELEVARQASRTPEFAAAAREIQAAVKAAAPKDTRGVNRDDYTCDSSRSPRQGYHIAR